VPPIIFVFNIFSFVFASKFFIWKKKNIIILEHLCNIVSKICMKIVCLIIVKIVHLFVVAIVKCVFVLIIFLFNSIFVLVKQDAKSNRRHRDSILLIKKEKTSALLTRPLSSCKYRVEKDYIQRL
jgi:hypothetical protein